jgi:RNA polymerase sigma-70 factor (ECF subfamily)
MTGNESLNFKELVDAHYSSLYRFAYSLAGNEHEASDLTQHTYFIYANKGSTIRDPSKIKSWLFTTLYREFLRMRRSAKRTQPQEHEMLEAEAPVVNPEIVSALDGASAVAAVALLDETYRAPIVLFYLQDLSYKEIAAVLEIPLGTVMSRLARGKAQLKKLLSDRTRSTGTSPSPLTP